jgi:hypothetical protein
MRVGDLSSRAFLVLAALALGVAGCSEPASQINGRNFARVAASASPGGEKVQDSSKSTPGDEAKAATAGRKIIYTGQVELVTEDLASFEAKLLKLVQANKAYVADSDIYGTAGSRRGGTWKVRVPVENYEAFAKAVVSFGELVSIKSESQDVSEEFYDLEARLLAKKTEEARLLKHLTESTGKLEEILAVERELSRVRTELERMQGRIRAIENLTTLTTLTIRANEVKGYVPEASPTFVTRIARTFTGSAEGLQHFGEATILFLVGMVPWIPVVAVLLTIAWGLSRRVRRLRPSK